jgi:alanine racemase
MGKRQRRTWAEVDLDILEENFLQVKKMTKAAVCCVIKADAYGHGATYLARKYESLGADFFAVSNLEEALQLRNAGIKLPILILGYTPVSEAGLLCARDISQCVYSLDYAEMLAEEAQKAGVQVKVHVKIDTGMSRLGFYYQDINRDAETIQQVARVCRMPGLYPEGIFTHFAVSDEGNQGDSFTMKQYGCFKEMIEALLREGIDFPYRHCANSAAIEDFPMSHLDMVRAGIILYGLEPSGVVRHGGKVRPALQLKSVVSHVKVIPAGATVSYGREYTAQRELRIATVPIGYADGYSRSLFPNGAQMLIHGKRCPIVGRVCMDQLMVDLGDLRDVKIGDIVTVIGTDGEESITADELAERIGTINYEVICNIGARVPRVYLEKGKEIGEQDYICPTGAC